MDTVHMINGTLVLIGYIALAGGYLLQLRRGESLAWVKPVSRIAGTLLLVQFALGFIMLTTDYSITAVHYIIALDSGVRSWPGGEVAIGSDRRGGHCNDRAYRLPDWPSPLRGTRW
jgi:hypothetical protein